MRLDYKPIVHIEKVKHKNESADLVEIEEEVKKLWLGVSNYSVKDTDIIRGNRVTPENIQTVKDLDKADCSTFWRK